MMNEVVILDLFHLDNNKSVKNQGIAESFKHPDWLMSMIFIAIAPVLSHIPS